MVELESCDTERVGNRVTQLLVERRLVVETGGETEAEVTLPSGAAVRLSRPKRKARPDRPTPARPEGAFPAALPGERPS